MTVVTINGITFDRFESTANGKTNVTYVARQTCMNEFGYLSVLAFSADTSNRFAVEDYDRVVASFRYYGREEVSTMPGEEIPRILPDEGEGGSVKSAFKSGSSSSASRNPRAAAPSPGNKFRLYRTISRDGRIMPILPAALFLSSSSSVSQIVRNREGIFVVSAGKEPGFFSGLFTVLTGILKNRHPSTLTNHEIPGSYPSCPVSYLSPASDVTRGTDMGQKDILAIRIKFPL